MENKLCDVQVKDELYLFIFSLPIMYLCTMCIFKFVSIIIKYDKKIFYVIWNQSLSIESKLSVLIRSHQL